MNRWIVVALAAFSGSVLVQVPATPQAPAGRGPGVPQGPPPTHANIDYAPPEPSTSNGHKLDLHIPSVASGPLPVAI